MLVCVHYHSLIWWIFYSQRLLDIRVSQYKKSERQEMNRNTLKNMVAVSKGHLWQLWYKTTQVLQHHLCVLLCTLNFNVTEYVIWCADSGSKCIFTGSEKVQSCC